MNIRFSERIAIDQAREVVFDYTQNYAERLKWDTFLKEARLLNAPDPMVGVRAWCVSRNGYGMETEYVSFHRPKVTAIKMTRGPFMFRRFAASWTFNAMSPVSTEVIFVYTFQLRFPFSLAGKFIRKNLSKNVKMRLSDLKNCLENEHTYRSRHDFLADLE